MFIENTTVEVYISNMGIFTFLPILGYDQTAPIVNYYGQTIRTKYSRKKIRAIKMDPYTGQAVGEIERKNFWYI